MTGPAGGVTIDGVPLADPIELLAVGQPEALSGSLTRAGGPIAQLGARFPAVKITVYAADGVTLPATERNLDPDARPPATI